MELKAKFVWVQKKLKSMQEVWAQHSSLLTEVLTLQARGSHIGAGLSPSCSTSNPAPYYDLEQKWRMA